MRKRCHLINVDVDEQLEPSSSRATGLIVSYHSLYKLLYRVLQIWQAYEKFFRRLHFSFLYFGAIFNIIIIPLLLVGYETVIARSALSVSLAIYHLTSNF